jgi:hypothetical protein
VGVTQGERVLVQWVEKKIDRVHRNSKL